jgi:hypothetical protein
MKRRILKRWAASNRRGARKQHVYLAGWHQWATWRANVEKFRKEER